ncbi:hypothetical protein BN2475_40052 [Paraburkholderia ribeironis]|uniref:Uncharacterized protein n=1 Tax=Paraburkholderia ribeironis TaxID=1247936 RepID=A0A1N7RKI9_9BURK|nr:hypothetical protein BN2475_40052 [Paraburkholderia ribeironis]
MPGPGSGGAGMSMQSGRHEVHRRGCDRASKGMAIMATGASHAGRLIGCPACAGATRRAGNIFRMIPKGGVHCSIDPADKTGKRRAGDGESDDSGMRDPWVTGVGLVQSEQILFWYTDVGRMLLLTHQHQARQGLLRPAF